MEKNTELNNKQIEVLKILTFSLSALLFIASLTQNTYLVNNNEESVGSFGLIAFLLGWMNLFGAGISWLANPFLLISWGTLLFGNTKKTLIFSGLALLFSLSFLLFGDIIANEGGGHKQITTYAIGYYLWTSSCGINFIGNLILYFNKRNSR
ncbi:MULTISPECIES: hypothetical protein [Flavobacterium]|uniref:hypothetical protein n=1 Tax=Flavobacterium TaxID=237 RepID=UPI001FCC11D0|nr:MULTISPECIES: hypothetical protein [Flavobacterium]UOK41596.1 hypothetical protein LZF87_09765 [Flavobacterium enshiense]